MASPRISFCKAATASTPAAASAADVPRLESQRSHSSPSVTATPDDLDVVADDLEALERPPLTLHPSFYILSWIFFSNCTILFNKWLIDNAGFPILLTCWHLIFATLATQLLARTTSLLDSRHALPIDRRLYLRTILPIGLLYSGSLVCSNVVYLYLSVPFIQMLKSAAPVVVLFFSWLWGLTHPTPSTLANILVIVAGVAMASAGEIRFSWVGFLYQVGGTIFEAMRLVMIQVMLSAEGLKMDPLVGLYYYAPICAGMNMLVAFWTEVPYFRVEDLYRTGFSMLFLNALVAFMLNVASVCLIGRTSGLVMTLTGILKSILLVITSVLLWRTPVTLLQSAGYSTALAGLVYYSLGQDQFSRGYHAASTWASDALKASREGSSSRYHRCRDHCHHQWTPERRRSIIATGVMCFLSMLVVVGIWRGPAALRRAQDVLPSLLGQDRL
ncbi:hypothetical protein ACO1O0_008971 [Amphichorda felina]